MRDGPAPSLLRYLPALAIWLFDAGFLALTYQLPSAARSTPAMVGWVTIGLATLDLLSRTRTGTGQWLMRTFNPAGLKRPDDVTHTRKDLLTGLALVACLVTSFIIVGVLPTAAIVIFGALMLSYRHQIIMNATMAAVATVGVWLLFRVLLHLQLYPGLAFGGVL